MAIACQRASKSVTLKPFFCHCPNRSSCFAMCISKDYHVAICCQLSFLNWFGGTFPPGSCGFVFPFPAVIIAVTAAVTDSRTGSKFIRAYMAVAVVVRCPRLLPMMGKLTPAAACQLPSVLLRSWIFKSFNPEFSNIFAQAFFGSFKWLFP